MEVNQVNWELALHDVKDMICKYLKLQDLYNLTIMNKSWREAALREKAKRFHIRQLRIPYQPGNLASLLDANAYTSLLIYDKRLEKSLSLPVDSLIGRPTFSMVSNGLEKQLLEDFKRLPPKKTIVLKVEEYLTTEDIEFQGTKDQCDFPRCNDILGLFIPSADRWNQVDVAWQDYDYCNIGMPSYRVTEVGGERLFVQVYFGTMRLAEELCLNDCKYPESTLLLFINASNYRSTELGLSQLFHRIENRKAVTWACVLGHKLVAASSLPQNINQQSIVALRISGPSVKSWTTSINIFSRSHEIERKLHELKAKVTPRRYCTGLLYSRKCYWEGCSHVEHPGGDHREIMRNLKRIFPDVSFVGLFNDEDFSGVRTYIEYGNHGNDDEDVEVYAVYVDNHHII